MSTLLADPAAATAPPPFDVCGPLPAGTTVLEASAGTGKTWTIAALTARYLAEGVADLSQLMLITFGRMATNELRMRVRERLVTLERQLALAAGGERVRPADAVERLLLDVGADELAERHARIARALADFDVATIATTHEFCSRMLAELGVLGDAERDAVFVEHLSDLAREVSGDVYLRRYAVRDQLPPLTVADAERLAVEVVDSWELPLVPALTGSTADAAAPRADPVSAAGERVAFAAEVRAEVARRKSAARLFTYDDMLTRLRDALARPDHGADAVRRLRERYRFVLVDEFQDTDPVQWEILRRGFHGAATLVLIGDPKQAIYSFRGADVYSYLDALGHAGTRQTLPTNYRSDAALVDACGTLLGGAALGDKRIVARPVEAHHRQRRLHASGAEGPASTAPIRLRVLPYDAETDQLSSVSRLRPRVVVDLVGDVVDLLSGGAELEQDGVRRPVGPADVAVLVRRNERAEALRDGLVAAGVPAVVLGASSVFASPTALEWLTLLRALEQPRSAPVRAAALTCFFGWSLSDLAAADDEAVTGLTQRVRWWGRVLRARGVAALLESVTSDTGLTERLLAQQRVGERVLTDVRHVAQSLHAVMARGQLGLGALVQWLAERVHQARAANPEEGMRRLETDRASVQILTVHRSKGLEFPVVYLPESWDRYVPDRDRGLTLRLHEGGTAVLDVGGASGPGRTDRWAASRTEEDAEDLRLLYVALTRAQCQVVTWWLPSQNTPASALQRLLQGPRRPGAEPAPSYALTGDPFGCPQLGDGFSVERMAERPSRSWAPEPQAETPLQARVFDRELDLEWRRTSYTALTAAVHGVDLAAATVASEAEPLHEDDEVVPELVLDAVVAGGGGGSGDAGDGDSADGGAAAPTADLDRQSPMAELPSGVQFGTLVHAVLEKADLRAEDLLGELRSAVADELARSQPGPFTAAGLAKALLPAVRTPLGPLAGGRRLCDIAGRDRLSELAFELPLAGGEQTTADVRLGALAPLLREHLVADDPLRRYPDLLEHPGLADQPLRGYLTGSIDAVLRVVDEAGPRYLVVDYKTNWLGPFDTGEPLTLRHYTRPAMAAAMMAAHYPLQALLYSVAVHRFLRWRQPGYDPGTHLGGVLYLFVRGMGGEETPVVGGSPCGVFGWRPAAGLVTDLSDLLEGR